MVNDMAERGVVLMEKYNRSLINNREQKQYLLMVVSEHRKKTYYDESGYSRSVRL